MTKPEADEEEQLLFCDASEAIGAYHARVAGKILLISDSEAVQTLAPFSTAVRTLFVVLERGDALPLFTMPDGVGGVIAAGGEGVMRAARFYAAMQKVTPLLLPADAAMDGAMEPAGNVMIGGEEVPLPLAEGKIVCDLAWMRPSLAKGYARLMLADLALFEAKALSRFGMGEYPAAADEAASVISKAQSAEDVIRANCTLRMLEAEGLYRGEGRVLAARLPVFGELAAYRALLALYRTFFAYGKPRSCVCPDYHARATAADARYYSLHIPSWEEYLFRVDALERMRSTCQSELLFLKKQEEGQLRTVRAFSGTVPPPVSFERLKILPELCPDGLSAVVRDFGLMEF